jgi:N-acetylglucosaminyl-diphospho-decaprenol L-rhamnosyltransferase
MTSATVVYVAYGVTEIDMAWIPDDVAVVVVHNDDALRYEACRHRSVEHIHPARNLGFGAAANVAMSSVHTERVILCNPDTVLGPEHFHALAEATLDEIVTVPLVEDDGTPNAVVSPYWGVVGFMATALRLGRFVPRGGSLRSGVTRLLGKWGSGHREALEQVPGVWPATDRWATGAVISLPADLVRSVGGFDEEYFLYFEDADLQQRLAAAHPDLRIRLADVGAGRHLVGGSVAQDGERLTVAQHRRRSAVTYATRQHGLRWRLAGALVAGGGR